MKSNLSHRFLLIILLAGMVLNAGCTPEEASPPTSTSTATSQSTALPSPTTTTTQPEPVLFIDPTMPAFFSEGIQYPPNWTLTTNLETANITITTSTEQSQTQLTYILAAPFNTVDDSISAADLQAIWQGEQSLNTSLQNILVSRSTLDVFVHLWGPASQNVTVLNPRQFSQRAWRKENHWIIMPFQDLDPQWKVIEINNQSPIHKRFDPAAYPLTIPVSLHYSAEISPDTLDQIILPPANYDPNLLVTVNLTGVTALVRATAGTMEFRGITYPATDIRDLLIEADITHINNEVPFTPSCPMPLENQSSLVFCSRPDYIELLEDVGTDVVELAGDHFQDWGTDAVRYTLDMYNDLGWQYYGGGSDAEDARQPALFDINGTRIAFLGCNAKPKGYAGASETSPGAIHCDMDWMAAKVSELSEQGYLPIVTFQHLEYYSYKIHPILQEDFRKMANAGAIIVSGSQAHQPQAVELYEESFLHYGLGNLFFDQYNESEETRQAFIDRHVFYNGKHISSELLTIEFTDYAHSQLMSLESRQSLLEIVFNASLWDWN
jgi:Bacterial capsule synthesis protein PGA_cap